MTAEPIRAVSVAEAKAHLSELLDAASEGEVISITRRGVPIATLNPAQRPKKPVDVEELRALTAGMTYQEESAGDFMRRIRDDARY